MRRISSEGCQYRPRIHNLSSQYAEEKAMRNQSENTFAIISGMGLGAGLMYVFDPDRGRRRRSLVVDKVISAQHELRRATDKATRDLMNRGRGIVYDTWAALRSGNCPDVVLEERVRARLGRVVSHPGAINVQAHDGVATLRGSVLRAEADDLTHAVASIRGVRGIENQLHVHKQADDISELQGGAGRRGERFELMQRRWAPGTRLLVGSVGLMMIAGGLRRSSTSGWPTALIGSLLLLRASSNVETSRLVGAGGRRLIDIQKTLNIHAPVEEVYRFWSNPENFPRFMTHVREVRDQGNGRYRWVVAGPGGVPVSWNASITEAVPNQVLAWASEPGAVVRNSGIVRFEAAENDNTRINVRISYNPPGGAIGHAVAALFGSDPKKALDDDLSRFKSLLEIGRTRANGQQARKEELAG
jgi:uncharacterized membrane protein